MNVKIPPPPTASPEEFRRLPEGPPHFEREPGGELIEVTSARHQHNRLLALLFAALDSAPQVRQLGALVMDVDVFFPSGRVYMPDLSLVPATGPAGVGPDGKVHGAPLLVVELLSPGGETRDRVEKFRAYREEGVGWYWLIDPELLDLEEYHLEEGRYVGTARHSCGEVFRPGVFTGLEIDLESLLGS